MRQGNGRRAPSRGTARSPARVADRMVDVLRAAGVDRVFGIPGGAIAPLFDALADADLEVVVAQHEAMATYLAYGHARATGRPGVVLVTSGPGVLNTVTALAAARLDEVPLVVIAGDVNAAMAGRGALQDGGANGVDVLHVVRTITRHAEVLTRPGRAIASLEHALRSSLVHPRGPVLLDLAMDLAGRPAEPPRVDGTPAGPGPAEPAVVAEIADAIAGARRPLLWLGVAARLTGLAPHAARLARRTGCPVVTDVEAKGVFPETDPLSLGLVGVGGRGVAERYLAAGVDCLLTVGARLDDATTGGYTELVRASERVIQLDHDADRLARAYDVDDAVLCDLSRTLEAVAERVADPGETTRAARRAAIEEARRSAPPTLAEEMDEAPHHPVAAVRALQAALPEETVFTSDIGNHLVFAAQHLVVDRPDAFHAAQGLGGMGSGIGVGMGLALAQSGARPVVAICGDTGLRMVGTELATCARHRIPVVLAVFDDGQLGMVEHGFQQLFGRARFCESPPVDVLAFARSLGARAVRIERRGDLDEAVRRIGDGPLVLHLPIRPDVMAANPRAEIFAFPHPDEPASTDGDPT